MDKTEQPREVWCYRLVLDELQAWTVWPADDDGWTLVGRYTLAQDHSELVDLLMSERSGHSPSEMCMWQYRHRSEQKCGCSRCQAIEALGGNDE